MSCLEPACGRGHMSRTLEEYFGSVASSDAYHYGYGQIRDFLGDPFEASSHDWVITNPPFRLAEEFVNRALAVARVGVAILARTVFLESLGQYQDRRPASEPSATAEESIPIPVRSPLPDDAHPDSNAKGTWPPSEGAFVFIPPQTSVLPIPPPNWLHLAPPLTPPGFWTKVLYPFRHAVGTVRCRPRR